MKTVFSNDALNVVAKVAERCNCASCHAEFVQLFTALWSLLLLKETKTVSYVLIVSLRTRVDRISNEAEMFFFSFCFVGFQVNQNNEEKA